MLSPCHFLDIVDMAQKGIYKLFSTLLVNVFFRCGALVSVKARHVCRVAAATVAGAFYVHPSLHS